MNRDWMKAGWMLFLGRRTVALLMGFYTLFVVACTPDSGPVEIPLPSETPFIFPTATHTPWPSPTVSPTITHTWTPTHTPTPTATVTRTPIPMADLVLIVQPVPAGYPIPPEAVQVVTWPEAVVPQNSIATLDEVINEVALVDLFCFQPVLESLIARRTVGSDYFPLPDRCPPTPELTPPYRYVDVAFAVQYIDPGQTITPHMIAFRPWPQALAPEGAVREYMDVVGKTSQVELLREQPLLRDYFR